MQNKIHQCEVRIYLEKYFLRVLSWALPYVLNYQSKNQSIWRQKGHFKEGLQLLHWCSSPASWREKAAVVNTVLKASRQLQIWKVFFPSRYFLVLSISYSQPSSFFCQSYTHEEDESSGKRGQRRQLQREVQYSENNLEVNEIRIAVLICNDGLFS